MPIAESPEDGTTLLENAEAEIKAEFASLGKAVPVIEPLVGQGNPGDVIEDVLESYGAGDVVLGARHRHLLGRLLYSDVRAHLKCLDAQHVHVAARDAQTAKQIR
jgi:nucleotide-binding universal stress UspA family protein